LSSSALVGAGSSSSTTVGLISLPDSSSISIYAGSSTASSAPFRVTWDGRMVSTSGSIGGFNIGSTNFYAGSSGSIVGIIPGSLPFFAGATSSAGANARLYIDNTGKLTASGATGGVSSSTVIDNGFINIYSGSTTTGFSTINTASIKTEIWPTQIVLTNGSTNATISYSATPDLTMISGGNINFDAGTGGITSIKYLGSTKLAIRSTGATVTGTASITGNATFDSGVTVGSITSNGVADLSNGGVIQGSWTINTSSLNPGRYLTITGTSGSGTMRIGAAVSSTIRHKTNLENYVVKNPYWFDEIPQFRLFNFNGQETEKKDFGIIIEEVEQILDLDYIIKRDQNNLPEIFQYEKIGLLLIPAIQDMKKTIENQQKIINNLENKIFEIEKKINT